MDPAQGCLPESISLCDPKNKSGKRQSAAQSDVDSWDQGFCADSIIETQESHPSIDVDLSGYSEGVRGKATRAVRRGAVQMAATGDETDLTLAFRWIGAEFTSARRASSLDDLSIAPLRTLFAAHGLGSQHHGDLTTDNDAHSAKWSAPKAALFRVKRRSSRSRLRSKTWAALTCLLAPDRLVDDHTRKHAIDPQGRDFPLIAQLYVDQAPLCLSGSKKSSASSCNTQSFGLRQGAFVRLPPLCLGTYQMLVKGDTLEPVKASFHSTCLCPYDACLPYIQTKYTRFLFTSGKAPGQDCAVMNLFASAKDSTCR